MASRRGTLYWDDINNLWGISRYRDVALVDRDAERYSSLETFAQINGGDAEQPVDDQLPRLRPDLVGSSSARPPAFHARAIAGEERIGGVISQLISEVERRIAVQAAKWTPSSTSQRPYQRS